MGSERAPVGALREPAGVNAVHAALKLGRQSGAEALRQGDDIDRVRRFDQSRIEQEMRSPCALLNGRQCRINVTANQRPMCFL